MVSVQFSLQMAILGFVVGLFIGYVYGEFIERKRNDDD